MSDRKILVENVSRATVVLTVKNYNFTRELVGEGAKTYVPYDMMIEALGNPGTMVLFDEGYLYLPNKQDRIDLGLEEDTSTAAAPTVMSESDMLGILNRGNNTEIKTTLDNLAPEQKKKFASVAIKNKISSAGVRQLVKNATGIDVLEGIRKLEQAEKDANTPDVD